MDPTTRFSTRVADYARHRPGYPAQIVETLQRECGLTRDSVIADIGCGTGLLAKLFCESGNRVYGVEPNADMLDSARQLLRDHPQFVAVAGRAEATTLPGALVDFVTAAQAFHWFERQAAKQEFRRILKLNGWVVLIWNERLIEATAFTRAYEELLLEFGVDYHDVKRRWPGAALAEVFAPATMHTAALQNPQILDRAGLTGRILSASYMPQPGHPSYGAMLQAIERLFEQHQSGGGVRMEQEMWMYYGQPG